MDQHQIPGSLTIQPQAIFSMALNAALKTYGVVGIASRFTGYDTTVRAPHRGLEVKLNLGEDGKTHAKVDIHIIADYGVRLPAVISSLQHQIAYAIEHGAGYVVDSVDVHIDSMKITQEDNQ